MYQPAHGRFIEMRDAQLQLLIRAHPLGTLIAPHEHGVAIEHVPFVLEQHSSLHLVGHIPRANQLAKLLDGRSVSIVFHGPNAYISPSWYPTKAAHGKVVPTWNYAVVHAHGSARIVEEKLWLQSHLESITAGHERSFSHPWKLTDAPADYIDKLMTSIVGLDIAVEKLEGKFKLGQNRPHEDQENVLRELDVAQPELGELTRSQLAKQF